MSGGCEPSAMPLALLWAERQILVTFVVNFMSRSARSDCIGNLAPCTRVCILANVLQVSALLRQRPRDLRQGHDVLVPCMITFKLFLLWNPILGPPVVLENVKSVSPRNQGNIRRAKAAATVADVLPQLSTELP
eukprot:scaffold3411_cov396-Prasinococcus_capsulatus_cf.AAC.10